MATIINGLYVVSGLYAIVTLISIISRLIKGVAKEDLFYRSTARKYALIFFVVALIISPVQLYFVYSTNIPEKSYTVDSILILDGDDERSLAEATINYDEDVEYYDDDRDIDYLRGDNSSRNRVVLRSFYFDNISHPKYEIQGIPDLVESGGEYDVSVIPKEKAPDEEFGDLQREAVVLFPVFTFESLGITSSDLLENIGLYGYIEHILIFVAAAVSLIFRIKVKEEQL